MNIKYTEIARELQRHLAMQRLIERLMPTCPTCKGSDVEKVQCPDCDGQGFLMVDNFDLDEVKQL